MRAIWEVLIKQAKDRAAHEGQVGHEMGVAAASIIFAPKRVPPPMVAFFHATPVTSDEPDPVFGSAFGGLLAGQIEAPLRGGDSGGFDRAPAANGHQGAGEGKIGRHWLDGPQDQPALVDASMAGFVLDKRGA